MKVNHFKKLTVGMIGTILMIAVSSTDSDAQARRLSSVEPFERRCFEADTNRHNCTQDAPNPDRWTDEQSGLYESCLATGLPPFTCYELVVTFALDQCEETYQEDLGYCPEWFNEQVQLH